MSSALGQKVQGLNPLTASPIKKNKTLRLPKNACIASKRLQAFFDFTEISGHACSLYCGVCMVHGPDYVQLRLPVLPHEGRMGGQVQGSWNWDV